MLYCILRCMIHLKCASQDRERVIGMVADVMMISKGIDRLDAVGS